MKAIELFNALKDMPADSEVGFMVGDGSTYVVTGVEVKGAIVALQLDRSDMVGEVFNKYYDSTIHNFIYPVKSVSK